MKPRALNSIVGALLAATVAVSSAGPLDPDCTAEKAAKSAAAKATVGVGGRCDPKEALTDSAKDVADRDDKDKNKDKAKDKDKDKNKDKDREKDKDTDKDKT
jgi:hypothetical protein